MASTGELPSLPDEVLQRMNISRERWEEIRATHREREERAPAVGTVAPDFELPHLGDTDRTVRLSSFRDKRPIALISGSYT